MSTILRRILGNMQFIILNNGNTHNTCSHWLGLDTAGWGSRNSWGGPHGKIKIFFCLLSKYFACKNICVWTNHIWRSICLVIFETLMQCTDRYFFQSSSLSWPILENCQFKVFWKQFVSRGMNSLITSDKVSFTSNARSHSFEIAKNKLAKLGDTWFSLSRTRDTCKIESWTRDFHD